ncbi:MAG: hypothetical protein BWY68_00329 [bacterium ADurb.Bin400]|nr:MAG: hypothetical protein BWY68_00329 [bacterium ADurb.Bin400]
MSVVSPIQFGEIVLALQNPDPPLPDLADHERSVCDYSRVVSSANDFIQANWFDLPEIQRSVLRRYFMVWVNDGVVCSRFCIEEVF